MIDFIQEAVSGMQPRDREFWCSLDLAAMMEIRVDANALHKEYPAMTPDDWGRLVLGMATVRKLFDEKTREQDE